MASPTSVIDPAWLSSDQPDGGQFLKEWYERLTDLSGGRPEVKGLAMRRPLDRAFAGLDKQPAYLSNKYSAQVAVLPAASKADFPVLFQNDGFRVVELREP
jgi:hypothetical protein